MLSDVAGYKAVQVSPPQEHIQGSAWWTRYQPVSYDLISRSGNETQFSSMIDRCAAAGVGIIVDSVINHMAAGSGTGTGGSTYGNRQYPIFGQQDFHHYDSSSSANCQVNDYSDKYNVQYCGECAPVIRCSLLTRRLLIRPGGPPRPADLQ